MKKDFKELLKSYDDYFQNREIKRLTSYNKPKENEKWDSEGSLIIPKELDLEKLAYGFLTSDILKDELHNIKYELESGVHPYSTMEDVVLLPFSEYVFFNELKFTENDYTSPSIFLLTEYDETDLDEIAKFIIKEIKKL